MEKTSQSSSGVAIKWAVIYIIISIVLTFTYQFLNVDQSSAVKYIGYIPFVAFLLLTQKEYRTQRGGFLTFGEGFVAGLLYAVFAGIMLAVFLYIYFAIISPQVFAQMMTAQQAKLADQGVSAEQAEAGMAIARKYGVIFACIGALIGTPIVGAIISLIGAAIFKKEPTMQDIERNSDSYQDPAV